jgi:YVTN family beta-propeller protein
MRLSLLISLALLPVGFLAQPIAAQSRNAGPRYQSPLGLAIDQTGERAYVGLHMADAVAVVDLRAGKVLKEIRTGKPPVQLVRIGSGTFVRCEPPGILVVSEGDGTSRPVSPKEIAGSTILMSWQLTADQQYERPGGKAVPKGVGSIRAARLPRTDIPTAQVAQGWVFVNGIVNSVMFWGVYLEAIIDEPQRGYADPADVEMTDRYIFVASAGADAVSVIDRAKLDAYNAKHRAGDRAFVSLYEDPVDLTESRHYIVARIPTQGNPRRLALSGDGKTLVVSNYLADSLTVVDTATLKVVRHIPLGGPPPDAVRRGEILFNSGKMTFHGQFTCASCHPNGESDGLTWDLTRDGVGNFKKTKSLLGVKDSAPYGWHGSSPTLADRVEGTLRTLHRHEPTGTEVADLVAYLESLPPPRPLPVKDADKPAVARGKALFRGKGECVKCHHRIAYDDGKSHNIGTRGPGDTQDAFDTPALRGVGRYAPYLHDGRAETLEEVFTKHNPKHLHGAAHTLTKDELTDLVAYLKSL